MQMRNIEPTECHVMHIHFIGIHDRGGQSPNKFNGTCKNDMHYMCHINAVATAVVGEH